MKQRYFYYGIWIGLLVGILANVGVTALFKIIEFNESMDVTDFYFYILTLCFLAFYFLSILFITLINKSEKKKIGADIKFSYSLTGIIMLANFAVVLFLPLIPKNIPFVPYITLPMTMVNGIAVITAAIVTLFFGYNE